MSILKLKSWIILNIYGNYHSRSKVWTTSLTCCQLEQAECLNYGRLPVGKSCLEDTGCRKLHIRHTDLDGGMPSTFEWSPCSLLIPVAFEGTQPLLHSGLSGTSISITSFGCSQKVSFHTIARKIWHLHSKYLLFEWFGGFANWNIQEPGTSKCRLPTRSVQFSQVLRPWFCKDRNR